MLNEREKWMFVLTVMKTSPRAVELPMKMKQEICEFIRKKVCPSINYDEWLKMEYDIRDVKKDVMSYLMQGLTMSMGEGEKLPPEAKAMFDEADFAKLDNAVRETDLLEQVKNMEKQLQQNADPELIRLKEKILEFLREKDEDKS